MGANPSFRLQLANGWTFSVADEMRPAICNVAAWPTSDPEQAGAVDHRWFPFADGQPEHRCYSMGEVGLLLQEVLAADPPEPI